MEEWPSIGSGMFGGMSMQRPTATRVPDFDPVALMTKKKQQQDLYSMILRRSNSTT